MQSTENRKPTFRSRDRVPGECAICGTYRENLTYSDLHDAYLCEDCIAGA